MIKQSQVLLDIESIKSLKAKYFRTMDMKDWNSLSECLTEDLVTDFTNAEGLFEERRESYMDNLMKILKDAVTIHQGNMPEIEILDSKNAKGIWAMEYIVMSPGSNMRGWGHYYEKYRKVEGAWKIASIKLTRSRVLHNDEEIGRLDS